MFRLSDFNFEKMIGIGTFGKVFLCQHISTSRYFALKIMKEYDIIKMRQVNHVYDEIDILKMLNPMKHSVNLFFAFVEDEKLVLILEYVAGGELFSWLRKYKKFDLEMVRFYSSQLVLALAEFRKYSIVYRDLKPENILLDPDGNIKLTDFGFAKILNHPTFTFCGTPDYMSPEIIFGCGYGYSSDLWSLGVLIYEMYTGKPPFESNDVSSTYYNITQGNVKYDEDFDPTLKDLISKLLTRDITKRLGNDSIEEIYEHPFFKGYLETIETRKSPIHPRIRHPGDGSYFVHYNDEKKENHVPKFFYRFSDK